MTSTHKGSVPAPGLAHITLVTWHELPKGGHATLAAKGLLKRKSGSGAGGGSAAWAVGQAQAYKAAKGKGSAAAAAASAAATAARAEEGGFSAETAADLNVRVGIPLQPNRAVSHT